MKRARVLAAVIALLLMAAVIGAQVGTGNRSRDQTVAASSPVTAPPPGASLAELLESPPEVPADEVPVTTTAVASATTSMVTVPPLPTTAVPTAIPTTAPRAPVRSAGELVSVATDGAPGNGESGTPTASGDGRLIAFVSTATNLVPDDANGVADIFVRDLVTGTTVRVLGLEGAPLDGASGWPSISGDGRMLAFVSSATNVVAGDTNGFADLFLVDLSTGGATRLHESRDDSLAMAVLAADGSAYAFATRLGVHAGSVGQHASLLAAGGEWPALSADGRVVAFTTAMRGVAPGDDVSNQDVYVHDRSSGRTTLVSGGADGSHPNAGSFSGPRSLAADGQVVTFVSVARLTPDDSNDTADVYVRNLASGVTHLVPEAGRGAGGNATYRPAMAPDGGVVVYSRPERDPSALRWELGSGRITSVVGARGAPKAPMNGLALVGRSVAFSTPEGEVLGQPRWDRYQVVLLR